KRVGRFSEGRVDREFLDIAEPRHLIQTASTYDSNPDVICHVVQAPIRLRLSMRDARRQSESRGRPSAEWNRSIARRPLSICRELRECCRLERQYDGYLH